MWSSLKVHLHVSPVYFFDPFHPGLENALVEYEHHHLLLQNPFLMFDENTEITWVQDFKLWLESVQKANH